MDAIEKSIVSREIVKTILDYGVTQQQILKICYLLSLELEDNNALTEISQCCQQFMDDITEAQNQNDSNIII
tara:strand:+ start:159 stop:374 length:216 start_codon:yes stop_codon:yes gene_type:complete